MGKPSKGKASKNKKGRHHHSKRRYGAKHTKRSGKRKTKFWIETSKERRLTPKQTSSSDHDADTITVLITRVLLEDKHTHGTSSTSTRLSQKRNPADQNEQESPNNGTTNPQSTLLPTNATRDLPPASQAKFVTSSEQKTDQALIGSVARRESSHPVSVSGSTKKPFKESEQSPPTDKIVSVDTAARYFVEVRRTLSAIGPIPLHPYPPGHFVPLPNGDCGDGICNPHDKKLVPDKYWAQRKRLFSRFDDGIRLSQDGWYSVTPEEIAKHIADRFVQGCSTIEEQGRLVVLDAFGGCGGNAIAFANHKDVSMVICIDLVFEKLELAAHNASVYGIDKEKLFFVHADAIDVLDFYQSGQRAQSADKTDAATNGRVDGAVQELAGYRLVGNLSSLPDRIDGIFLSPPWGGSDYLDVDDGKGYNIETSIRVGRGAGEGDVGEKEAVNGKMLLQKALIANSCVAYFLPRNVNGVALAKSALNAGYRAESFEMEQNVLNSKLKTVTAYFGFSHTTSSSKAN